MRQKARMARIGDVRTFENFVVRIPDSIDVSSYNTVIVWSNLSASSLWPRSIGRRQ